MKMKIYVRREDEFKIDLKAKALLGYDSSLKYENSFRKVFYRT